MGLQINECKPMKQIGFDVGGHSSYDDQVWETLNEISGEYGLSNARILAVHYMESQKELHSSYGFDHWLLLPTMLAAGAIIIGKEEKGECCQSYSVYIRNDDTVDAFCERMKKIRQFY